MLTKSKFQKQSVQSVYCQIADFIKNEIVSGRFRQGECLPTEHEMADTFGASRLTIRRGLKILEEQHFITQQRGRGTFVTYQNDNRSIKKIAICGDFDADDVYLTSIFKGIQKNLQKRTENQIFFLGPNGKSLFEKVKDTKSDGLIVIAPNRDVIDAVCDSSFDNFPLVIVNASGGKLSEHERICIDTDNEKAVFDALKYLKELGHKRIAYIASKAISENMKIREKEYKNAVKKLDLDRDKSLMGICETGKLWFEESRKIAVKLLKSGNPPSAIFCPGRSFAYGAWQGIMDCSLKIPEDVSILGFDCEYLVNPNFTTMKQPLEEMGMKAGDSLIVQILHGKLKYSQFLFEVELVERKSCASFRSLK